MEYGNTLFAMPSLIRGAARVLDLGSTMDSYNTSDNDLESDYEALKQDWMSVGADLYGALDDYKHEQE
ncbi:hypothetical protein HC026_09555 [Lactobacillus sp. LC28-10]|uniref:Uncharacterized protein n=1 Tax=Secundilactobacillus angelensis TaxID=2722706 RepID=A0ABX1KYZ3_9LACO|nr:hypothetical protein [Secundilactobacillus angelensis]MCH5462664.1 hypothetical protein [Secundilactobacillus angelensis]NLR19156.1 hypothetical protein [Secundilactobacillus angelensis]